MTGKPVVLGPLTFGSRKELREYLSQALVTTGRGNRVSEDLDAVLRDLIQVHPDAERKVGAGIDGFTVRFMPPKSNAFFIERVDGSREDFSFHKCLAHLDGTGFREREIKAKLRDVVKDETEAFRASLPEITECVLTGTSLRRNTAHIDHAYPNTFSRIISVFLKRERLTWSTFPIGASGDPVIGRIVTDPGVAWRWRSTHRTMAHLRPVDPAINSKIGDTDPALHAAVMDDFIEWAEDNREICRMYTDPDQRRKQREYMLPRIREVFYGHPSFVNKIERGHAWLTAHEEDDSRQERWFAWLTSRRAEAA